MDRTEDERIRNAVTNADSIIEYFDNLSERTLTMDEWTNLDKTLDEWFANPDISDQEKWKVRLSGYMEMLSMILR